MVWNNSYYGQITYEVTSKSKFKLANLRESGKYVHCRAPEISKFQYESWFNLHKPSLRDANVNKFLNLSTLGPLAPASRGNITHSTLRQAPVCCQYTCNILSYLKLRNRKGRCQSRGDSLYTGHCRDIELLSSLSRVLKEGTYFSQKSVIYFWPRI